MTLPLSIQIFDPAETLLREFSICLDLPAGSGEISHFNYSKLHTPVGKQSAKAFCSYKITAHDNNGKVLAQTTVNFQLAAGTSFGIMRIDPQEPQEKPVAFVKAPAKPLPNAEKAQPKPKGPIKSIPPPIGPSAVQQQDPFAGMPGSPGAYPPNAPYAGNWGYPGSFRTPMMGYHPMMGGPHYYPHPSGFPQHGYQMGESPHLMAPDAFKPLPNQGMVHKPTAVRPAGMPDTGSSPPYYEMDPFPEEAPAPVAPPPIPPKKQQPPTNYRAAASTNLAGSKPPGAITGPSFARPYRKPNIIPGMPAKWPENLPEGYSPWTEDREDYRNSYPFLSNGNCFAFKIPELYFELKWETNTGKVLHIARKFPHTVQLVLIQWKAGASRCKDLVDSFLGKDQMADERYPDFPQTAAWMAAFHHFARTGPENEKKCFKFNSFRFANKCKFGSDCKFRHECYLCGAAHGMFDRSPPPNQRYHCMIHRKLRQELDELAKENIHVGDISVEIKGMYLDACAAQTEDEPEDSQESPDFTQQGSLMEVIAAQPPNPDAPNSESMQDFPTLPAGSPENQPSASPATPEAAVSSPKQPATDADGFQKPKKKKGKARRA